MTRLLVLAALFLPIAAAGAAAHRPPSYPCTDIGPKPIPATIVGTQGNDKITGTPKRDVIAALGGDDTVDGGGGDDLICGGDGNDQISGGVGDDVISGDGGNDVVDGGPQSRNGVDFAAYDASPAAVKVSLATGIATGWGSDRLVGIEGLSGTRFGDMLAGSGIANVLIGQRGNDVLAGLAGSDLLSGSEGNDVLNGGRGPDLALYQHAPRSVRVDLARGVASGWGRDRLRSIENAVGSRRADRLYGNAGPNGLWGLGGADLIDGRGGRDHGFGGAGRDRCLRIEIKSSC